MKNTLTYSARLAEFRSKSGFTLVELAIVVVIIGLLIGGVIGGQSLIKSAETRSIINEFNQINTAVAAFKLEYDALPGDMKDATSYWSTTTNGNGNGRVNDCNEHPEASFFWEQLKLSNIFTYTAADGNYVFHTLKYGKGMFAPVYAQAYCNATNYNYFGGGQTIQLRNALYLAGVYISSGNGGWANPAIGAKTLSSIDKKIDNGLPLTGNLIARNSDWVSSCIVSSAYKVTSDNHMNDCDAMFYMNVN